MENVEINQVIQADLIEDRKINIKSKFTNAFRKIVAAIKEKRETIRIPSVRFIVVKALKKAASALENEAPTEVPTIEKAQVTTPEPALPSAQATEAEPTVQTVESEPTVATIEPEPAAQTVEPEPIIQTIELNKNDNNTSEEKTKQEEPTHTTFFDNLFRRNKDEHKESDNANVKEDQENLKIVSGRTVSQNDIENKKSKEEPVKTAIPINLHFIPAKRKDTPVVKETKPAEPKKSDPEALEDLNKQYGDLIGFNTWEDYYNSFSDEERENKTKNGELLTEERFISVRLEEAQTIKRITQAEETERQTQREKLNSEIEGRRNRVKENRDTIKSLKDDIERREKENVELNKQNQKAGQSLRTLNNESDKANTKIDEMDEIITQLTPENQKTDENSQKIVDDIFKEEEAKFNKEHKVQAEKQASKNNEEVQEETPKVVEPQQVSDEQPEQSLVDEISNFDTPTVINSTNPDYPGTLTSSNGEVTADWKTSPITTASPEVAVAPQAKSEGDTFDFASYLNNLNQQSMTENKEPVKGRTR